MDVGFFSERTKVCVRSAETDYICPYDSLVLILNPFFLLDHAYKSERERDSSPGPPFFSGGKFQRDPRLNYIEKRRPTLLHRPDTSSPFPFFSLCTSRYPSCRRYRKYERDRSVCSPEKCGKWMNRAFLSHPFHSLSLSPRPLTPLFFKLQENTR